MMMDMVGVVCRVGASPAPKKAKSPPFVLKLQPVKMPMPAPIATWMPAPPAWHWRAEEAAVKCNPTVTRLIWLMLIVINTQCDGDEAYRAADQCPCEGHAGEDADAPQDVDEDARPATTAEQRHLW